MFQQIDSNDDGILSREEFKLWTTGCLDKDSCDTDIELNDLPTTPKTKKFRERYLYMVDSFSKWANIIPNIHKNINIKTNHNVDNNEIYEDRMNIIITGCFSGAKNPGVVKSLGILYEDYLPLRVAGDIIFKIVKNYMKRFETN